MKKPNPEKLALQAAQWNLTHPAGTPVMRYKLIEPLREGCETKTRSEAWVMAGHCVMVLVDGVIGGVLLDSVKPLKSVGVSKKTKKTKKAEKTKKTTITLTGVPFLYGSLRQPIYIYNGQEPDKSRRARTLEALITERVFSDIPIVYSCPKSHRVRRVRLELGQISDKGIILLDSLGMPADKLEAALKERCPNLRMKITVELYEEDEILLEKPSTAKAKKIRKDI